MIENIDGKEENAIEIFVGKGDDAGHQHFLFYCYTPICHHYNQPHS